MVDQIVALSGVVLSVLPDELFSLLLQQLPQEKEPISVELASFDFQIV